MNLPCLFSLELLNKLMVFVANAAYVPISYRIAFLFPQMGSTPNALAVSCIFSVGCSARRAAIPVLPLPAKASRTVSSGFVAEAI